MNSKHFSLFFRLLADVEKKLAMAQEEKESLKNLEQEISSIHETIKKIEEKIKLLDCYVDDLENVDKTVTVSYNIFISHYNSLQYTNIMPKFF